MKTLLFFIMIYAINIAVFSQIDRDVYICNNKKNKINLFDIKTNKDTTIIVFCSRNCKPCIKELDFIKNNELYKKYNFIIISINNGKDISDEITFFNKYPFEIYYDTKNNAKLFFIENNLISKGLYIKRKDEYIISIPQSFLMTERKKIEEIENIYKYN